MDKHKTYDHYRPGKVMFGKLPRLSAGELLNSKRLLRVDEVAFILSISPRLVYTLVYEGKLERLPDSRPLRILAESVRSNLQQVVWKEPRR